MNVVLGSVVDKKKSKTKAKAVQVRELPVHYSNTASVPITVTIADQNKVVKGRENFLSAC